MGAWGVALYSDDFAMDVRGDYVDALKFGKTDEEALQEVLKDMPPIGTEDESVFWYALADTMWNYGRLTQEVKDKALFFLENVTEDDRWDSAKTWEKRKQVLNRLREKLLSEQPPRKRVSPYPKFRCQWKRGDVFAYQFHKKVSEEYGAKGKYIIFRKVTDRDTWPYNVVPIIQFYRWIGDEIPTLDEIQKMPFILVCNLKYIKEYAWYLYELDISSNRDLKAQNYQYLGNIQDDRMPVLTEEQKKGHIVGKATNVFEDVFLSRFTEMKDGKCIIRDDC